MGKILMLADDFTGAGDSGVQMTKNGIEAHIVFDANNIDPKKSYVIDTESRNISGELAYAKVHDILEQLSDKPFEHYFKKIDSTIRGNICDEVSAAAEVLKPDVIVFNPANPDSGRTVEAGRLMMNGVRICETEIMRDPLCLVTEDHLPTMLTNELKTKVQYFSLSEVREKKFEWDGSPFVTFDVLSNQDFATVVNYFLNLEKRVLWVGSAGMANNLFAALQPHDPVLCLVGSISQTSRQQVKTVVTNGIVLVELNIPKLLRKETTLQEVADEAVAHLDRGRDVVVVSAKEHEDYLDAVDTGRKLGMERADVAKYTQERLGELSTLILARSKVSSLFLTGGDTAISVSKWMHSDGAKIIDEVQPTVALIELDGGDYPGLTCVVKGGSIGTPETIWKSIVYLKERRF